jgi:hypothetical protein
MIPTKREDLIAMGYVFDNEATCRGCREKIEWWITPKGKKMPMTVAEVKDESKPFPQPVLRYDRVPHWGVCPNAEDFRRKK